MKISIITATYNSAATVRDTLESVLSQTHRDWELIIEDGLSQDDTLKIVREYESQCDGRLRIFSEKDEGLYDAMNRGIARATGDVIGILNSDDFYYDARVLEDINRVMEDEAVDCVFGDLQFVRADDPTRVVRTWKGSPYKKGAFLKGWHPAHPSFYARRACFTQYGVFNTGYAVSADFELMLRFLEVGQAAGRYIPRYFVKMRMGGESTGSLRNIIRGNKSILRAFRDHGLKPAPFFLLRRMLPKVWDSVCGKLKKK